jgi:valyl-tRNA synthetase
MHWMTNIKDWCISRQLWWGHRIPAWYDSQGNIHVARSEEEARAKAGGGPLTQDDDVLDTWFSSALWPFSTLGWPAETRELKTFYPTSVMETGYDILFFWVARMMMMGLHFMKKVPFRTIFLHAMVVDENGDKMSKVKGNVIDPLDVIHGATLDKLVTKAKSDGAPESALANIRKQFPEGIPASGADALRFTLAAMAAQGRNIRLAIPRIEGYRHFANKIWNAARFALIHLKSEERPFDADAYEEEMKNGGRARLSIADRWILSRLQRTAKEVGDALEAFKFNEAAQVIYRFLWSELCDWYIELAKPALNDRSPENAVRRRMAQGALATALETAMRLLHPFMPFITEEVWQSLPRTSASPSSIMITLFPSQDGSLIDEEAEATMSLFQDVVVAVRNFRSEFNIGLDAALTVGTPDATSYTRLESQAQEIRTMLRPGSLEIVQAAGHPLHSLVSHLAGNVTVALRPTGDFDAAAQIKRIEKELEKVAKELERDRRKLGDEKFLSRAPSDVVAKVKGIVAEGEEREQKLRESKKLLDQL